MIRRVLVVTPFEAWRRIRGAYLRTEKTQTLLRGSLGMLLLTHFRRVFVRDSLIRVLVGHGRLSIVEMRRGGRRGMVVRRGFRWMLVRRRPGRVHMGRCGRSRMFVSCRLRMFVRRRPGGIDVGRRGGRMVVGCRRRVLMRRCSRWVHMRGRLLARGKEASHKDRLRRSQAVPGGIVMSLQNSGIEKEPRQQGGCQNKRAKRTPPAGCCEWFVPRHLSSSLKGRSLCRGRLAKRGAFASLEAFRLIRAGVPDGRFSPADSPQGHPFPCARAVQDPRAQDART